MEFLKGVFLNFKNDSCSRVRREDWECFGETNRVLAKRGVDFS